MPCEQSSRCGQKLRIKVCVWLTNSYMCKEKKAEQATEAARKVYDELKDQLDIRSIKLSLDEGGRRGTSKALCTSRLLMKKFCLKDGLGLVCSAECSGDIARVIEWKSRRNEKQTQET